MSLTRGEAYAILELPIGKQCFNRYRKLIFCFGFVRFTVLSICKMREASTLLVPLKIIASCISIVP